MFLMISKHFRKFTKIFWKFLKITKSSEKRFKTINYFLKISEGFLKILKKSYKLQKNNFFKNHFRILLKNSKDFWILLWSKFTWNYKYLM